MSRTKKFFLNTSSTAIMQIVTMTVGIIVPKIMLDNYGSEINGLVSSITQFITYFNLVEAGLASAAIFALYKPLSNNNHKEVSAIVTGAKKFYTQSGYIFLSLVMGLAFIYPQFVEIEGMSILNISILVLILGGNGVLEFFTLSKYRVLLSADQKTYVVSLATTIQIILNTIVIAILGRMKVDIVLLRSISLLTIFLRSLILMVYCQRNYSYINYKEKPNFKALDKRWNALTLQLLGTIQTGAPIIIITLIVNDLRIVSIYTIFNMVISGVNGILSIFISGLSASFGEIIAKKEIDTLQRAYKQFELGYYCLITIIYTVTFITIMPFIKIYTYGIDDINYNIPIVGFLFVLNGLLYNIKTPQGMLVMSAGLYKETQKQALIQGVILVVVSGVLAVEYGIVGVLIGSIISNLYRTIDLMIFIPEYVTKLSWKLTCKRMLLVIFSSAIVLVQFNFIVYEPQSFIGWGTYAGLVSIYSSIFIIFIYFIFENKEFKAIIEKFIKKKVKG